MNTLNLIKEQPIDRFTFAETLSGQFVAMTGYGVYVYLSALDVDQLFNRYLSRDMPIRVFVRQCVKNTLG